MADIPTRHPRSAVDRSTLDRGEPASAAAFVVGVDLGGTKVGVGIASDAGVIVAERVAPTRHGDHLVPQIVDLVRQVAADAGVAPSAILATGVGGAGVPGDEGTTFAQAPNLRLSDMPFARQLSTALAHPVVLENDVNVAAIGELHDGAGLTHSDFVFISLGTGIGMGIVIDGRLVRGATGAAGEIGYLPLGADPAAVENHRRGPLEEVVAGDALVERYRRATGSRVSVQEIFARAQRGDLAAFEVLDEEARWVAMAIVAVDAILDPEVFILGGGIGLQSALIAQIREWLGRLGAGDVDVRLSKLGTRAPIAGAVRLALDAAIPTTKGHTP